MVDAERVPVVVAAGQVTERDAEPPAVDIAEQAARTALEQCPGLRERIDRVTVVDILSGAPQGVAGLLARRLGLEPGVHEYTAAGGNTPQWLVNRAADDIRAGRLRAALITGGESSWDVRRRPQQGGDEGLEPDTLVGDSRRGISDEDLAVKLAMPAHIYPMLESVRAAAAGHDPQQHRDHIGRLLAPFTEVAAKHPYAWFAQARSAEEIAQPSPQNRVTAEPYTKLMNAFPSVVQGAALVVTSLAEAQRAGVADQAVYVWGGADATDVWFPVQRPDLGASPGIATATGIALSAAGVSVDDLRMLDLYSCFPVAVQMAADALGLAHDDPRRLTVTGGLPYFGGPGNNYVSHSIATVVDRLRDEGGLALVTGLGWYATKHSAGVYGAEPPPQGYRYGDTTEQQQRIDATALPVEAQPEGEATVAASTVVYDKGDGSVRTVFAYLDLPGGRRAVATAADDGLQALAGRNLVGARVRVVGSPPQFTLEG